MKLLKRAVTIFMVSLAVMGVSVYAEESKAATPGEIDVMIPSYQVRVNGVKLDNERGQYPLLSYKGITYFPMTWDYAQSLGLETSWSQEAGFGVKKTEALKNFVEVVQDGTGINQLGSYQKANIASFNVSVNGEVIDNANEEYPLFIYNNVTYFPMTWKYAVESFGKVITWDNEKGFGIASDYVEDSLRTVLYRVQYPDGGLYVGQLKGGKRSGYGTYTWKDGKKYVGIFIEGSPTGEGNVYFTDGTIKFEGEYSFKNKDNPRSSWVYYSNSRYGYIVKYPDAWKELVTESEDQDGAMIYYDEITELKVYATETSKNQNISYVDYIKNMGYSNVEQVSVARGYTAYQGTAYKDNVETRTLFIFNGTNEYRIKLKFKDVSKLKPESKDIFIKNFELMFDTLSIIQ